MASISSLSSPPNLLHHSVKALKASPKASLQFLKPTQGLPKLTSSSHLIFAPTPRNSRRLSTVAEDTSVDTSSESARRLYIGNIPRTLTNDELTKIVQEHGAVEKAEVMYDKYSGRSRRFGFATMKTVEDANAAIEKLNGTEIEGREIKVNITEKPPSRVDLSLLEVEESQFVDSPHKVYVGNLAKTVTTETLKNFFSEKGNVLSSKVSRVPGTSRSTGYGFVSFSSEEDVEAAISSFNNSLLEGQPIRVNKA
ncbi:Splicing factor-like protein [Parasponia andersonii]|uniref:Small ribosomal subunit protein cS22 n=1 Tax=Parasponia andersonii TaxID=3476 RepID=A0A2P5AGJ5_PARAD|nr:Splicing factor-like protein [Parasponia andersonii]